MNQRNGQFILFFPVAVLLFHVNISLQHYQDKKAGIQGKWINLYHDSRTGHCYAIYYE